MSLSNPRRRSPVTRREDNEDATQKTSMTLRKGATFHSRPSPSPASFVPPCLSRSQTHLDDVVDANRRRIAMTLSDVDEVLAKAKDLTISPKSPTQKPLKDTSLPIPAGFLDLPVVDPAMAKENHTERRVLRPRSVRRSQQSASDSGLGSSIKTARHKADTASLSKKTKTSVTATAITRSAATANMEQLPALSRRAVNRIHEHTLTPLLEAETLKDFQPIILDVPRRIRTKDIICLRDLEKTLIFMAPERAKSATFYLDFCLQSIRCIQATVEYVSEREQIRPGDRPYTNGYFIDLKDQIHQYARELASAKKESGLGEEMDLDSLDEIRLHGGIAENGRPAELIRVKKDGSAISLATGKPIDIGEAPVPIKRSLSEQRDDEEEIMRSMARRKKNATAEELAPKQCREPGCNKEFKRPCDLTKHEKTHSRPWKCPIPTCKYHEFGWPTEKEMGRHLNDKHSDAPAMYECMFKPCPYKSKRESNCKQHMEKAHGWTYVRTKTPANKKVSSLPGSRVQQQPTPPLGNASTPSTTPSYSVPTPPQDTMMTMATDFPAYAAHDDWAAQFSVQPEWDTNMLMENPSPSSTTSYEALPPYQNGSAFILGNDEDLYAATAQMPQMPTPEQMASLYNTKMMPQHQMPMQSYQMPNCQPVQHAPHFSPSAQQNAMLYTPNSLQEVDESFDDGFANGDGIDFTLFPNSMNMKADPAESMFADAPSAGLGFSQTSQQDMFMDWANMNSFPLQE
ncbi:zinc finger transcription factor ace1 [Sarocladium implicatum]|nr:zinc finger transcription factor ace1 [Sarocladium implicatum]